MAITFYYGAGSPFAWRVWLALEHKALALRCENKKPDLDVRAALPQPIRSRMQRIEGLRYFSKTWPAHWE